MPPPRILLGRTHSAQEARGSHDLLSAIEDGNINSVRSVLLKTPAAEACVLTTPSLMAEHFQRSPLMAAAFQGSLVIFTTLIHHLNRVYPDNVARDEEMRTQLEIQDKEGMTVAMHAARSGSVAILSAVMAEITHTGAKKALVAHDFGQHTVLMHAARVGKAPIFQEVCRAISLAFLDDTLGIKNNLLRRSGDGKTILMHAASAGDPMALLVVADTCRKTCDPKTVRCLLTDRDAEGMSFLMHSAYPRSSFKPPSAAGNSSNHLVVDTEEPPTRKQSVGREEDLRKNQLKRGYSLGMSSLGLGEVEAQAVDPTVPIFKISIALVKECLWKEQVREELTATDLWGRTVLTHAVRSGHAQLFEAALGALRDDVLDTEVEDMLHTNEDERDSTPLRSALAEGGPDVQTLFVKRRNQLKKDVSARGKLATIEAKIQTFIPGKLVVIFQLLLPEIDRDHQIYLLVVLCILAPLFNWASALLTKENPTSSSKPSLAPRKSLGSLLLGCPAMFFWGIGTSNIGLTFGWEPALSAAALAVATICIPAVDAFLNSRSVEQWYDQWSCQRWRFTHEANRAWHGTRTAHFSLVRRDGPDLQPGHTLHPTDTPVVKDAPAQASAAPVRRLLTMMSPYPEQAEEDEYQGNNTEGINQETQENVSKGLPNVT